MGPPIVDSIENLLALEVIEAKNLPAMDLNGKADPFFKVLLGYREVYQSQTVLRSLNPEWHQMVRVPVRNSERGYHVHIHMWDWDKGSKNDMIGSADIEISRFLDGQFHDLWLPLKDEKKDVGSIHIRAKLMNKNEVTREFWYGYATHFDIDRSGTINQLEFTAMVSSLLPELQDHHLTELFNKSDLNKDGCISFEEAYKLLSADENVAKALNDTDPEFIWKTYARSDEYNTVGNLVLNRNFDEPDEKTPEKCEKITKIHVHDRRTGQLQEEKIPTYIHTALKIMYSTPGGRSVVDNQQVRKLLHHLSASTGKKYDDPRSKDQILQFIEFHGLDVEEILDPLDSFKTFNEFFFRKLKPSSRPIDCPDDPKVAVSPADCRMHVFSRIDDATQMWIKGKGFSLSTLLKDENLVRKFTGGSLVIARLAPQDYHRFHLPVDCTIGTTKAFDGALFTVNPIAIREDVDVYTENKRMLTLLNSDTFGSVGYIAVGATMVGSVRLTTHEGQKCKKGGEQGYFAFGGSTVLLLFEPGAIRFDDDLVINTNKPIETLIKMGQRIGVCTK